MAETCKDCDSELVETDLKPTKLSFICPKCAHPWAIENAFDDGELP